MLRTLVADARIVSDKRLKLDYPARLIWADPPTNRGMNEYATSDRLDSLAYQEFAYSWLTNMYQYLHSDGRLAICCYYKIRRYYENIMINFPMKFEQELIWNYEFGLYTRRKFVPSHDNILIYRQGKPPFNWEPIAVPSQRMDTLDRRADMRGRTPSSVLVHPRVPGNSSDRKYLTGEKRTCQPLALLKTIVLAYTNKNDLVLDPFMGSGTMAKVCQLLERNYVGMDICKQYVEDANKRINNWKDEFLDGC